MKFPLFLPAIFMLFSLAIPVAHCSGYLQASIEKDWDIDVEGPVESLSLIGFFLINNSDQQVVSVETNGIAVIEGDRIKINYTLANPPQGRKQAWARAVINTRYNPYFADQPLQISPIPANISATGLSLLQDRTPQMEASARALASNSSLETIAAINEWVFENMEYDISYFGLNPPASQIFSERRGVCTEYTRLFISMLSAVGLESRAVSGYAFQNGSFQPHAWAEVSVGNQTVPADPTFGEVGALSAEHVAMQYSENPPQLNDSLSPVNRSGAFEYISTTGRGSANLSVSVSMTPLQMRDFNRFAEIEKDFNNKSGALRITVRNPSSNSTFISYGFYSPAGTYGQARSLFVLPPDGEKSFTYELDKSKLQEGYVYTIPIIARIQGSDLKDSLAYKKEKPAATGNTTGSGPGAQPANPCLPASLIFILLLALLSVNGNYSFSIRGAR